MKTSILKLKNENVTLTTYLLDSSPEMPNTFIRPAILILPGGGYRACSDREAEPVAMAFLAEGYHVFVLRYSLNQHAVFPKPLNDAEEALDLIRQHSGEWGIDPNKVAVCGFSAGGHLAAALGTMGRVRPNAMILGYPCILATMEGILPAPIPGVDETVDAATPPAFIFHTFADTLVPVNNALALASAMDKAKVPFEMHIFQNGVHGLSLAKPVTSSGLRSMTDANAAEWFGLCTAWIRNVFGNFPSHGDINLNENIVEYTVDVQLGVLWKNPACKSMVLSVMPVLENSPQLQDAMGVPLKTIIEFADGLLSNEGIDQLNEKLKAIPLQQ
ncbi:alpha/beta hydrolase [Candidatus Pristimantibacillus sp. PTI5]|uniref:alpha/beta hydrolase n=1 Tax=Candidatus Pristimantibacillus sp. PTI5 TaxID=3400422 RepID=UPI003B016122